MLATYMRRMRNNNLKIRIARSSCRPQYQDVAKLSKSFTALVDSFLSLHKISSQKLTRENIFVHLNAINVNYFFRSCPANYTCMANAGPNPDHGFTSFDNIGWALLMAFQILTMDYWENLYNKVIKLVCYTAVFSVVTQRSSPLSEEERCVTTLKTAV